MNVTLFTAFVFFSTTGCLSRQPFCSSNIGSESLRDNTWLNHPNMDCESTVSLTILNFVVCTDAAIFIASQEPLVLIEYALVFIVGL